MCYGKNNCNDIFLSTSLTPLPSPFAIQLSWTSLKHTIFLPNFKPPHNDFHLPGKVFSPPSSGLLIFILQEVS